MAEVQLSYCAALIKLHDHDRYLTALLAPRDRREDLFALYAFNLEIARIAEVVGEAALGHMRLQWWREALAENDSAMTAQHPVAAAMWATIARRRLDRTCINRILDGRADDLQDMPPADLAALESYAEATSANLVLLALECLIARTTETEAAGRAIGIAWALTGLLRAVPFHARQRRLYLPQDAMTAAGLDPGSVFRLQPSRPLQSVVKTLADRARDHLQAARAHSTSVPRAARSALMLGILADRTLQVLQKAAYDPFSPAVQGPDPSLAWRVAWAHWRGRF